MSHEQHFLPYQIRWLEDRADIKVWEKSRRIGATYVQAYEDVRDALQTKRKVWFSSADESAAREYIGYCAKWASVFNAAFEAHGETIIDEARDVKALQLSLPDGVTVNALTSNPTRFRSKGGKAVWDEAAWHKDPEQMWDALEPVTMWGDPLRVLSTHNGKRFFHRLVRDVQRGAKPGTAHSVTITQAVADGLLSRITGRETTDEERRAWLAERRARCRSEEQWLQEYMCTPVDEADAFLTYEMIAACEDGGVLWTGERSTETGNLYLGFDVGRKKDLSVIWLIEEIGPMLFARVVKVMQRMPFRAQKEVLYSFLEHPKLRRACLDSTGLGMQLAEEAQSDFGRFRVEPVSFTSAVKEELAYALRRRVEEKTLVLPESQAVREDLHSVRRTTTASGNPRFAVEAAGTDGHADRFWAAALACHAVSEYSGPVQVASRQARPTAALLQGFGGADLAAFQ